MMRMAMITSARPPCVTKLQASPSSSRSCIKSLRVVCNSYPNTGHVQIDQKWTRRKIAWLMLTLSSTSANLRVKDCINCAVSMKTTAPFHKHTSHNCPSGASCAFFSATLLTACPLQHQEMQWSKRSRSRNSSMLTVRIVCNSMQFHERKISHAWKIRHVLIPHDLGCIESLGQVPC